MAHLLTATAALFKDAARNWLKDYAQSMGAALAFYTIFSIAPLLLIVISIAGLVFGRDAVHREIFIQLQELLGSPGATAVQGLLDSAADSSAVRQSQSLFQRTPAVCCSSSSIVKSHSAS